MTPTRSEETVMDLIATSRTREVYDRGDGFVVKVALNDEGFTANAIEANWPADSFIPLAPYHFEWPDPDSDAVLVMEKIARFPADDEYAALPDWTGWVDCQQVGYLADGRLVAYDL